MLRKTILSIATLVTLAFLTEMPYALDKKKEEELNKKVEEIVKKYDLPGAVVGVWFPGEDKWEFADGFADLKTKAKLQLMDHFRVGSITKTFVVTGLLQLVDQGKVALDDAISKYIPDVPNGDKITLRQLANMTSGLPNYTKNKEWLDVFLKQKDKVWTPDELLKYAFSLPNDFEPGEKFEYCNTNTVLLGLVIQKVSGMKLAEFLKENIFKPLKLANTYYPLNDKLPVPFAHGYAQEPDGKIVDDTYHDPSWSFAAGTLISNLQDLKVWMQALGTGKLISKESFQERLKWDKVEPNTDVRHYMLGIGFDNGWLMHEGELPGYNAKIAYLPKEKAIFVALVNTDKDVMVDNKRKSPTSVIFKAVTETLFPKNVPVG